MFKKLILVGFVFLFPFNFARAEVVINEVFFPLTSGGNPSSKQWIEIYNDTNSDIDITQYKIKDAGVVNGHDISVVSGGSKIIPTHEYGVIANDISSINVTHLFHSALKIIADDTIVVFKDSNTKNTVVLSGSSATGNSLQLIDGKWKAATPTPGAANETEITLIPPTVENPGSVSSVSSATVPETKTKIVEEPKIKTQITAKTLGFVGLPLTFNAITLGLNGEQLHSGKYFWNFSDGDSKEIEVLRSGQFTHTYFYPGDYVVSLYYFSNPYIYSNIPDASNQINIKIIKADISISRVGDEKDFFVELSNNTDFNVDISNWFLISDRKSFTIPLNTILAAKKKMIISSKITNFSIADQDTLKLMNSEREIVFDYTASENSQELFLQKVATEDIKGQSLKEFPQELSLNSKTEIPVENLPVFDANINETATALESDAVKNNFNNSYLPIFGSIVFIGASAGAVYFIRRKKVTGEEANDFEILDE